MSGQKYYSDGIIHYQNDLGTLYYTPLGGTGNVNLTPTPVYWMTTTNFSREERTKSVWVQGTGTYESLSFRVPINQDKSPLMILLRDIGGVIPHNTWQNPQSDVRTWNWQYTHVLHTEDLGKTLDIDVLVNGNVIDVSAVNNSVGEKCLIEEIVTQNLWVTSNFTLPQVHDSDLPNGQYEDYPSGLGTESISTYKVISPVWGENTKKFFDIITISGDGHISNISVPNTSGVIMDRYPRYGELQGLVAVRFQVEVNSVTPENNSKIFIKTAVYDPQDANGIDFSYQYCSALTIEFIFNDDEVTLESKGDDRLAFSPAGTMSQGGQETHNPHIDVASNIPWTVTETEPESELVTP